YEVLTAFVREVGFLCLMLSGLCRVGPYAPFFATLMVDVGTCISMFWLVASNSWMQTPAGYAIENGIIVPQDWLAIIFNPSIPYRLFHMRMATFLVSTLLFCPTTARHLF
ncbi:cytochrome ubiquinol oxidase subunit I, partial [Acinetobacter radioresistens]